jgi:hypothetical protein
MNNINIPIKENLTNTPMDLGAYLSKFIGVALILASVIAFGYLVLSGVYWITAGGDEKKIEMAKERITGAIIGLGIVASSWALFLVLDYFFGLGIAGK